MNMNKNFEEAFQEMARHDAERPLILQQGIAALERLFDAAQTGGGQSKIITMFLLGLYDGSRFRFDMTDFRCLDANLFDDCIAVLKMDSQPEKEIHQYLLDSGRVFEDWAKKENKQ